MTMQRGQLTNGNTVRTFTLAGNSRFTLVSQGTGSRFTYRVRKMDRGEGWFVNVLTGPSNDSDYRYIGCLWPDRFARTRNSRVSETAPSFVAFAWFTRTVLLTTNNELPSGLEFWHEGRCGRCGRLLTVPQSIESGIGPVCAGREG